MHHYKIATTSYWSWGMTDQDAEHLLVSHEVSVQSINQRLPKLKAITFEFNKAALKKSTIHKTYLKEVLRNTKIEQLTLKGSSLLIEIPREILHHSLKRLTISNCQNLQDLSILGQMTTLEAVTIGNEKISLTPSFFQLPNLQQVSLIGKQVDNFHLLPNLSILKNVFLSQLKVEELPKGIEDLIFLEHLNLTNLSPLKKLPRLNKLRALKSLNFSTLPQLNSIPDDFETLTVLKKLTISQVATNQSNLPLPSSIGKNNAIEELYIYNCPVQNLMKFHPQNQLKRLTLNRLDIENLPDSFQQLRQLEFLHIDGLTKINTLKEVGSCVNLKSLSFQRLPELKRLDISFENFYQLEHVHFQNLPKIEQLPQFGARNQTVQQIGIQNIPQLKAIPDSIRYCINLERLEINQTAISTLPKSYTTLKNLERLNIVNASNFNYFPSELVDLGKTHLQVHAPHILDGSKLNIPKIVQSVREKIPAELHHSMAFWIFNNFENEDLTETIRQHTFKGLSYGIADLQILILKNLYRLNPNQQPFAKQTIQKGDKMIILGTPQNKKTFLKEKIEELGFKYVTKLIDDVKFILLAKKPKITPELGQYTHVFLSETEFMEYKKVENPGFLEEKDTPKDFLENLRRLIWSNDPANEAIALEMVTHNGLPENMDMDFIVVAKTSKDKNVRNRTRKFLKGNINEGALKLLNDRAKMNGKYPPYYKYLQYVSRPKIAQIAATYYLRTGDFMNYFWQNDDGTSPVRQEMVERQIPLLTARPHYVQLTGFTTKEINDLLKMPVFKGQLKRLHINSNNITDFPTQIFEHQTINELVFSGNFEGTSFPVELCSLPRLATIRFHSQNIEVLPNEILNLAKLKELNISAKKPLALPEGFEQLKKLKRVHIQRGLIDRDKWKEKLPEIII